MQHLSSQAPSKIINRASEYASRLGINVCITIVDAAGHLQSFLRMDGAIIGAIDVSQRKARTSALFRCNSGEFGKLITDEQLIGMENSNGGLMAFPGGIPIFLNDEVVGAIGVSGGSAEQDHLIANYAIADKSFFEDPLI